MANRNSIAKITHVIFDMDGLLLDSEKCYEKAYENMARRFGAKFNFELKKQLTGVPAVDNARLLIDTWDISSLSVDQFVVQLQKECAKIFSQRIPLMPGAERLVRHLHARHIPIAIATSTKRINFELKTTHHRELFGLFDHIVITPDDPEINRGKPDPQPFLVCAARFVDPPKDMLRVLVFEDSIAGIKAANAAGMRSVWVPDSRMPRNAVQASARLKSLEHFKPEMFGLPAFD